jgi:hypothetical protein
VRSLHERESARAPSVCQHDTSSVVDTATAMLHVHLLCKINSKLGILTAKPDCDVNHDSALQLLLYAAYFPTRKATSSSATEKRDVRQRKAALINIGNSTAAEAASAQQVVWIDLFMMVTGASIESFPTRELTKLMFGANPSAAESAMRELLISDWFRRLGPWMDKIASGPVPVVRVCGELACRVHAESSSTLLPQWKRTNESGVEGCQLFKNSKDSTRVLYVVSGIHPTATMYPSHPLRKAMDREKEIKLMGILMSLVSVFSERPRKASSQLSKQEQQEVSLLMDKHFKSMKADVKQVTALFAAWGVDISSVRASFQYLPPFIVRSMIRALQDCGVLGKDASSSDSSALIRAIRARAWTALVPPALHNIHKLTDKDSASTLTLFCTSSFLGRVIDNPDDVVKKWEYLRWKLGVSNAQLVQMCSAGSFAARALDNPDDVVKKWE